LVSGDAVRAQGITRAREQKKRARSYPGFSSCQWSGFSNADAEFIFTAGLLVQFRATKTKSVPFPSFD
jgi:hypothetical protein